MNISKRIFAISFGIAATFSVLAISSVSAQDELMTSAQISYIRENCVSVKNTLNQLHSSDALLRVNSGQTYELMSTRLMERFNSRVSSNRMNSTDLAATTSLYGSSLDTFRADYKTYEEHLSAAIGINCLDQPVAFYDAVNLARTLRSQVHADVVKLNQYVDQYQNFVSQLEKEYQAATNGVGK